MKILEYFQPTTVQEAISLLTHHGEEAKLIAGGQSLIAMMRQRVIKPNYLIGLKGIPGLTTIEADGKGGVTIGAMATHRAVETSPIVLERCGVLAQAEAAVASIQVRNAGTLGGDVCHAEPGADPPAALIALGALARITGSKGERMVPFEEFFKDYFETVLSPDELLTSISIPPQPPNTGGVYLKHCVRGGDMAIVGVAAILTMDGDVCKDVKIGINGAALTPVRAKKAEEVLKGKRLDDKLILDAGRAAAQDSNPLSDAEASAEYRREMVEVFVRRAVKQAAQAARRTEGVTR